MPTNLTLQGDLAGPKAQAAVQAIDAIPENNGPLVLDLSEAEITEGTACAALTDAIRRAAHRLGEVIIQQAPQVLAHTLYRIGALSPGTIQLIDPREELGHPG